MGSTYTQLWLVLVLCSSLLGASMANKDGQYGFDNGDRDTKHGSHCQKKASTPKTIIVGGSAHWTYGFNYSVWAFKNGPFYVNDTLVFKYDPPSANNIHPHSVYLLPDMWSYMTCNLTNGVKIANESHGTRGGFKFVLKKWQPYYFACGGGNGFHCNVGQMKFFVLPYLRH